MASYEFECFRIAHVNCEHNTDCSPSLFALIGCGDHSSTASDSKPVYSTLSKFTAVYDVMLLKLPHYKQILRGVTAVREILVAQNNLAVIFVFNSSNTVIASLNLTRGMDVCLNFSCTGTRLVVGLPSVQEVLQMH
jgi:hypothetical protein